MPPAAPLSLPAPSPLPAEGLLTQSLGNGPSSPAATPAPHRSLFTVDPTPLSSGLSGLVLVEEPDADISTAGLSFSFATSPDEVEMSPEAGGVPLPTGAGGLGSALALANGQAPAPAPAPAIRNRVLHLVIAKSTKVRSSHKL